jgi:hypothetical protein
MKKSDYFIILILMICVLGYFLITFFTSGSKTNDTAYIYSGYGKESLIITIDFKNEKITINNYQDGGYPNVDEVNHEILILSFFEVSGAKTTELIRYSFKDKSVQIVESLCPNQICVKQGKSQNIPIICIPGKIRVEFSNANSNVDVIV